jgi:hypothetical protein
MKIEKAKLDSLYEHVKGKGSSELDAVAKVLGVAEEFVDDYVDALMKRNPELFNDPVPEETAPLQVFIKDSNNLIEELEIISTKKGRIVVQRKIPRDLVEVIVAGQVTTVDLLELRRQGGQENLIVAAEVAKG